MNIIGRRKLWYAISIVMILPGLVSLILWGLNLGIDFEAGQLATVRGDVTQEKVEAAAEGLELQNIQLVQTGEGQTQIRFTDPSAQAQHEANHQKLKAELAERGIEELSFDSVGPAVSSTIARNAIASMIAVSVAIVLYIAFAFRNAPPPVSPWGFGIMAIAALLHDALFVLGVFSLLGHFFDVEVDALFVTAILTTIGFSVHDTIVVFDRIRENLRREKGTFETIVNHSILETIGRSINTSVTVLLTLLALYLFGGQSIKMFVLALMIGIASGTYSSIFNASPLLVTWHNYRLKRMEKARLKPKRA
ncbi:MAG: protein-export rane protein SecF, preprotein translocase subunit SecF [Candidatus Saccharibacteria bacterium]|nr:protein-export rane protein SecF, preprotein translocase subunit SecF [Candidatus Saccharibacteria bacterium]